MLENLIEIVRLHLGLSFYPLLLTTCPQEPTAQQARLGTQGSWGISGQCQQGGWRGDQCWNGHELVGWWGWWACG